MVAVGIARGYKGFPDEIRTIGLKEDGYLTLDNMNRYIRKNLPVIKKDYYKRGERPLLKELLKDNKKKAIICVRGHYVYADQDRYYSFFDNDEDEVICIWWLK